MNATTEQVKKHDAPNDIDRAYVAWMLRVAPDKRTLLLAFRAGYLAQSVKRAAVKS